MVAASPVQPFAVRCKSQIRCPTEFQSELMHQLACSEIPQMDFSVSSCRSQQPAISRNAHYSWRSAVVQRPQDLPRFHVMQLDLAVAQSHHELRSIVEEIHELRPLSAKLHHLNLPPVRDGPDANLVALQHSRNLSIRRKRREANLLVHGDLGFQFR